MKIRIYTISIFNLIACQIFGQININSYWVMSQNNILTFKDSLKVETNGKIVFSECNSSICDSIGNILFYTDGIELRNKYNKVVKNSEGIGYQAGVNTSRQGVLLLSVDNDKIFLFNTDFRGNAGGLVYSIIDPKGNNDSGEVILKRKTIVNFTNESITGINHQNNKDIWILAHDVLIFNRFYKILLSRSGVIQCILEQLVGPTNYTGLIDGQTNMKFSPDGQYLARTIGQFSVLELYKFNKLTGDLKFLNIVESYGSNNFISGIEFSENSRFLYYTRRDSSITQYDILNKSKRTLKTLIEANIQQIQITPFKNILVAIPYKKYYASIENIEGNNAYFKDSSIYLNGNETFVDVPNFNQSYFFTPSIDYMYEQNCINNKIKFWGTDTFNATTYNWQIKKKGKLAEGNYTSKNISHFFSDTGLYEVRYIASNGNSQDTVSKLITIYPKIYSNFLGNDTAYAQGRAFSKNLSSPLNMHCVRWQDGSGATTFKADTAGVYICKITNQSFCEVTDTVVISECINSLIQPNIKRSSDSLYIDQTSADSFVWFKNNVQYRISKEPFIKLTDTGSYRVEAAKKGYCNKSSNSFQVKKLGLSSYYLDDFNIQLFPNPSFEIIHIKTDKNFLLQVSDFTGRTIAIHENIDSISLPKGVYFFTFTIDAYKITEKVVVL